MGWRERGVAGSQAGYPGGDCRHEPSRGPRESYGEGEEERERNIEEGVERERRLTAHS